MNEQFSRFCNGLPPPCTHGEHAPFFVCPLDNVDRIKTLSVDEWECVCAHMTIRDRRAMAATCRHGRYLDRSVWRAQRWAVLPERIGWHDLCYVAHMPLAELRVGGQGMSERLDLAHINTDQYRNVNDVRLCVCVAARLVTDMITYRKNVHLHGIDLWRTATHADAHLLHGTRHDEKAIVACIAALSQNPLVGKQSMRGIRRREPFFLSLERLTAIFHGAHIAAFALEALSWQWLWSELKRTFAWCSED